MNPKFSLDIKELLLDGFSNIDPKNLNTIITAELSHLLKARKLPNDFLSNQNIRQLDFGTFSLPPNSGPYTIGRQIAQSIYSGFNHGKPYSIQKTKNKSSHATR